MKMSDFIALLAENRVPFKFDYQMSHSRGEILPVITVGPFVPNADTGHRLIVDTYERGGVYYILRVVDMATPGLAFEDRKISFNDLQGRIAQYRQTHATDEAFDPQRYTFFASDVDYANQ